MKILLFDKIRKNGKERKFIANQFYFFQCWNFSLRLAYSINGKISQRCHHVDMIPKGMCFWSRGK